MKGAVIAVIAIILIAAVAYLYFSGYFYSVTVTGVYVTYQNNLLIKYIKTNYSNTTINLHGGQKFTITLNISSGIATTEISSITVSSPFQVFSTNPPTPFDIKSGSYMLVNVTITAPMSYFKGPIQIVINGNPTI